MFILAVSVLLRVYAIGSIPPAATLDEASIGYNAYSIATTGRDEYKTAFPILLRAYDDWRPALYVYLVIPFLSVFGVTAFAVRMPSVLLSIIAVYLMYRIGSLIGNAYGKSKFPGIIAAGLLAISPWHTYISRLGHEANLGFTLFVAGVYFFLRSVLSADGRAAIISAVCFGLSVYGYQSEKIVTPLLVALGTVVFWKTVRKQWRTFFVSGLIMGAIIVPAYISTISPEGLSRFRGTSAFSPYDPMMAAAKERYVTAKVSGNRILQAVNGTVVTSIHIFVRNYVSHFSPAWMFTGRDREAFKVPGAGLLYIWESVGLLFGIWVLCKHKKHTPLMALVAGIVFLSPVPASITTQAPHAMRAYTMAMGCIVIEAIGLWYAYLALRKKAIFRYIAASFGFVVCLSFAAWVHAYFVRYPKEQSDVYQYALREAVQYANAHKDTFASIQFAHQGPLYQSYMFFLFYTKYDPEIYQRAGGTKSGGYQESHAFGSYAFGYLPKEKSQLNENTLYFYDIKHIPSNAPVIERFTDLSGNPVIAAVAL